MSTLNNKPVRAWTIDARFRVNELIEEGGVNYRNVTGFNSDPKLKLGDWSQDVSGVGGGGSGNTLIKEPQLTKPSGTDVTNGFLTFLLSSSESVAFVTVNGQVLDDSEYNLVADTITVTPDNGFNDIEDEVLVFQHSFSSGAAGVKGNFRAISAVYVMVATDYIIQCIANTFNVTLPIPDGTDAGKTYIIKNSGAGVISLVGTVDGVTDFKLLAGESVTLISTNTEYIII